MTDTKLKVLVAEDHPINQEIIKAILQHHGFDFKAVINGLQVIALLKEEPFDVILMDMEMPVMNGCETTELIRNMEKSTGHHVRIIALTANGMEGDREICLNAGMDCFLTKPINPDVMIRMIKSEILSAVPEDVLGTQHADNAERQVFNSQDFNDRLLGQKLTSVKMASLFLKGLPSTLEEIDQGLARGDMSQVARFAHRLGGAAAMLGAEQLALVAEELESDASVGSLNTLASLHAKLKTMAAILSVDLAAFVNKQN